MTNAPAPDPQKQTPQRPFGILAVGAVVFAIFGLAVGTTPWFDARMGAGLILVFLAAFAFTLLSLVFLAIRRIGVRKQPKPWRMQRAANAAFVLSLLIIPWTCVSATRTELCISVEKEKRWEIITELTAACQTPCCAEALKPKVQQLRKKYGAQKGGDFFNVRNLYNTSRAVDQDNDCVGFVIEFYAGFPCHDDQWVWESTRPDKITFTR